MALDEFGRELPPGRGGGGGGRPSPSPPPPAYRGRSYEFEFEFEEPPSDLYQALPTSRTRKRRHRSSSPDRKAPAPRVHPSKLYVAEPMLSKVVWEEKQTAKGARKNVGDGSEMMDPDNGQTYDDYRRAYCLNYVRVFFNVHLDDTWFRSRYSPLGRVAAASHERARAATEANELRAELEASLSSHTSGNKDKCYFIVKARLGGGVRQSRRDDSAAASSLATNRVPMSHVLALSSKVLAIEDVPPHVTDAQLTAALINCCKNTNTMPNINASSIKLYSSSPATTTSIDPSNPSSFTIDEPPFLSRTAYLAAPDDVRKEIISQLHSIARGISTTPTASGAQVPRKEDTHNLPKFLDLVVECRDAYGRSEIDADGKGGSPETDEPDLPPPDPNNPDGKDMKDKKKDDSGVPQRTSVVLVSTQSQDPTVQVLSVAVSSKSRIRRDQHSALKIAKALDRKNAIPEESNIVSILTKAISDGRIFQDSETTEDVPLQDVEDALDVTIAYLRRVHLLSFYNGCQPAPTVGDVLSGSHATSTIHLRLANADAILQQAEEVQALPTLAPIGSEKIISRFEAANPEAAATFVNAATGADGKEGEQKDDSVKQEENGDDPPPPAENEQASSPAPPERKVDMLVQRLDDAISKAMETLGRADDDEDYDDDNDVVVCTEVDAQARQIVTMEGQAQSDWMINHTIIDEDDRARCAFHFCRKLFKGESFLHKHLLKKHAEFLRAEKAKCHDSYMMEAWDQEDRRPVPPILVNCGNLFQMRPSQVIGAEPIAADPEPDLWERHREYNPQRPSNDEYRNNHNSRHYDDMDTRPPQPPRASNFVDVDDMKEEKVELTFDEVAIPLEPPKKKKRKKKLL